MVILLICWLSCDAFGYQYQNGFFIAENRKEHFFDRDQNGYLDIYERANIKTFYRTRWPLANTKWKKLYDMNSDQLLSPYEFENYIKAKKAGIKKPGT